LKTSTKIVGTFVTADLNNNSDQEFKSYDLFDKSDDLFHSKEDNDPLVHNKHGSELLTSNNPLLPANNLLISNNNDILANSTNELIFYDHSGPENNRST